ncbi:MAG: TonB-dependent receptor [Bacteroidales bacterium]|nr:TonB-dependent receptor [Bacteroidales bacterium]
MRRPIYSLLLLLLSVVIGLNIQAQNVIKGTVKDAAEGVALPYAQIKADCLSEIQFADINGNYRISIPHDTCTVEFMSPTYSSMKRVVIFTAKQREIKLDVKLNSEAQVLDQVNVVSSKYENNPETSTSSLVVLDPKKLESKNINSVDELLNNGGGVAVVDNEPQIRGGSGFSSGMGSRVMILLDDIPMLRADAGRPMWNFIPMECVEQVDVLKGAASVVFGSSALTGAINVLTAYPRNKPTTKVSVFAGMYSCPADKYATSWLHHNPLKFGASFMHSRIIKKNFDLIIGGEYFDDQGYIGPEERISVTRNNNGSSKGKFERRGRFNFTTRYRFEKVKGLSISLNGNFMYSDNAQSFFWFDGDTNRYRTYKGSLSHFHDFTFYLDPVIKYVSPKGSVHSFRNRITYSNNAEMSGAQDASSILVFDEYQFNKNITRIGLNIVAGVMNIYAQSYGRCFNGDNFSDSPERIYSDNLAMYAQLEESLLRNRNLKLLLGGRWEFYKLENEFEHKPIFRAGINYQIWKSKTAFRASFGQGYRYPSIGERYIAINVGRYGFYPNPQLKSETSWNVEFGIMQPFKIAETILGAIDVAFYHQNYKNYIEFAMGPWGNSDNVLDNMGFIFLNTGPARISGVDFSLMGGGDISNNVALSLMLSYTYSNPVAKDRNLVYYTHRGRNYTFANSSSDTTRNVLKYRIEHMAKIDVEFTFWKKFRVGASASYYSAMKNVDKFFFDYDMDNPTLSPMRRQMLAQLGDLPFRGFYNYCEAHKNGSLTFDARISYTFPKGVSLAFIVKNIFNNDYTLRPMYLEPPRTFTLQFKYNLN